MSILEFCILKKMCTYKYTYKCVLLKIKVYTHTIFFSVFKNKLLKPCQKMHKININLNTNKRRKIWMGPLPLRKMGPECSSGPWLLSGSVLRPPASHNLARDGDVQRKIFTYPKLKKSTYWKACCCFPKGHTQNKKSTLLSPEHAETTY